MKASTDPRYQQKHDWYVKYYKNKKNRERMIARAKQRSAKQRAEYPEKFRDDSRKRSERYYKTPKGFYTTIVGNAKRRGIKVLISRDDFVLWYESQLKVCSYCEIPEYLLFLVKSRRGNRRLSVDRIDSRGPYSRENMLLCCLDCNRVKWDVLSHDEMKMVGGLVMKRRWQCLM